MIKPSNKIELHYYFQDESHAMNAIVRNDCEKELLLIFKDIVASMDIEVSIESEAFFEGGLKEKWKLIGKNSAQITLIIAALTIFLSRIPVENKELVNLQIENLKLDNELKKQELKKINNNLKNNEDLTEEVVEKVIEILSKDYKLIWHKSNYYKKLNFYPKVTKLTTQQLDDNNTPVEVERTVSRNEFGNFILRSDIFPPNLDEEAIIDIISPVLKKGNFSWKGFYKGEIITFEMSDKDFKNSVLNKEIEFNNGSAIKCVLQQNRKIDDIGLVQIVKNKVLTVLEVITGDSTLLTAHGKKYKYNKQHKDDQLQFEF